MMDPKSHNPDDRPSGAAETLKVQGKRHEKLIVLLNFPNNPTGYMPTVEEGRGIVAAIEGFSCTTSSGRGKRERTREQLYRQATRLKIGGRSTMSKAQLERAVDRAKS